MHYILNRKLAWALNSKIKYFESNAENVSISPSKSGNIGICDSLSF